MGVVDVIEIRATGWTGAPVILNVEIYPSYNVIRFKALYAMCYLIRANNNRSTTIVTSRVFPTELDKYQECIN